VKKLVITVALLCVLVLLCVPVMARTYTVSGTDISVEIDDSQWYVFTRDNIRNNAELDELGLTYEYMNTTMRSNNIYLDAVLFFDESDYVELFVVKEKTDSSEQIANLSKQPNSRVEKLAKEAQAEGNLDFCEVYKNDYTFLEIANSDIGLYLCSYVTVINQEMYTLKFQSTVPYTTENVEYLRQIVDSVSFDVDPALDPKDSFFDTVLGKALIGAAIGAVIGGVIGVISSKKKKAQKEQQAQQTQWPPQYPMQ